MSEAVSPGARYGTRYPGLAAGWVLDWRSVVPSRMVCDGVDGPVFLAIISRRVAKSFGLTRYFTGKPCPYGHFSERMVSSMACRACAVPKAKEWDYKRCEPARLRNKARRERAADPAWQAERKARAAATEARRYLRNREKILAAGVARYAENREHRLAINAAWHALNKDSVSARKKIWAKTNGDKKRASKHRYRARSRGAVTSRPVTVAEIKRLFIAQRGKCAYCRKSLRAGYHVDHIQPLSLGGAGGPENLQLTCATCNLKKSYLDPLDFARRIGRLL